MANRKPRARKISDKQLEQIREDAARHWNQAMTRIGSDSSPRPPRRRRRSRRRSA